MNVLQNHHVNQFNAGQYAPTGSSLANAQFEPELSRDEHRAMEAVRKSRENRRLPRQHRRAKIHAKTRLKRRLRRMAREEKRKRIAKEAEFAALKRDGYRPAGFFFI